MVGRRSSSYHLCSDNSRTEIDVRRQFSQRRNKKCSHNNYSISPHNRSYTEGHSSFRYDGEFKGGGILWHNRKGISSKQLETSLSKSFESFFSKINIRKERLFCVPLIIHEKVFYNFKKHGNIFPSAFISYFEGYLLIIMNTLKSLSYMADRWDMLNDLQDQVTRKPTLRRLIFAEISFHEIDFRVYLLSRMIILSYFRVNLFSLILKFSKFCGDLFSQLPGI